jgi:hypothetical protein
MFCKKLIKNLFIIEMVNPLQRIKLMVENPQTFDGIKKSQSDKERKRQKKIAMTNNYSLKLLKFA